MTWQIALAISLLAGVVTILVQRQYAQNSRLPAKLPPAISYTCGVLPIGIIAGWFIFPHHVSWSVWVCVLLVLEAASMATAQWIGFSVSSKLGVAPLQTTGRVATVTVIILGWIVLGEKLTTPQAIGATFLFAAAILAAWTPAGHTKELKQLHTKYILLSCLGAVITGVALVTEKALLGHMQIGAVFLVGWTAQTIALLVLANKELRPKVLRKLRGYEINRSISMGLANGTTGVFYVYAIAHANNITLVTAVMSVGLPLSVLCAYVFLHEREQKILMLLSVLTSFVGLLWISI